MSLDLHKTQTAISAEGGLVVIRHNQAIGTQWLPPDMARRLAESLRRKADEAEVQKAAEAN
jgi:hypothetical protein